MAWIVVALVASAGLALPASGVVASSHLPGLAAFAALALEHGALPGAHAEVVQPLAVELHAEPVLSAVRALRSIM